MSIDDFSGSGGDKPLRPRLRAALVTALKARDTIAVSALRSALAAIDNAEAVELDPSVARGLAIEQVPVGVGATEVSRRTLTEADVKEIVRAEVAEREAAAVDYDRADQPQRGELLRSQASVLSAYLSGAESGACPPGHGEAKPAATP